MESSAAHTLDPLQALSSAVRAAAATAGPAVVGLGRRWGAGSGVVIGPGRVLTNAHNLRGDETTVTFADDRTAAGRLAGGDPDLRPRAARGRDRGRSPPVPWEPDETPAPQLGDAVLALGNPGGRGLRVTPGLRLVGRPRASAARAAGASAAASSTPRRSRAARPAGRSSTARAGCSASTPSGSRAG